MSIEEQARREAEAWVKTEIDEAMLERRDIAELCYAAALIAERTKQQPTTDKIMSCIDNYFDDSRFEIPWDILNRNDLRDRFTKLFTHRP